MSSTVAEPDDSFKQRLAQLEEQMHELQAENERLREELQEEREARRSLVDTLGDTDPEDAMFDDVTLGGVPIERMLSNNKKKRKVLTRYVLGDVEDGIENMDVDDMQQYIQKEGTLPDQIDEEVADLEEQIQSEEQQRGQQDGKLRRRIEALADELDVEIVDSDIYGEDKIRRVLKHGASDLDSNPTKVALRAECLLRHIGKWGEKLDDANGKRILITSPTVADRLEDVRDVSLSTSQITRIFSQIEQWGADSPRVVRWSSGGPGGEPHKLRIELDTE